ncbi:putative nucleic acid-binding protein [Armatimonas rosea]|uniref:Putative nucleic acid-binding protein n=2 Tax=Armatimonas rosea TaxID=685828 RepID=A0A7W9W7Z1_ARMRO|nr:putative nucleic acid-binding protein [Armatimonas rosea]
MAQRIMANTESIFLSTVVVREILRGAMASISEAEGNASRGKASLVQRYALLELVLARIQLFQILCYSDAAESLYQSWPKSLQRMGPNDCRIAASAVVTGITVVTRNTGDFSRIAEHEARLVFEDWASQPAAQ